MDQLSQICSKHFCKQKINLPWIYDFLQMLLNVRCDKLDRCYFICEAHLKINEFTRFAGRGFIAIRVVQVTRRLTWTTAMFAICWRGDMFKLLRNLRQMLTVWWSVGARDNSLQPQVKQLWSIPPPFIGSKSGFGRKLKHDRAQIKKLVNFSTLGIAFPKHYHYFFRAKECFPNERIFFQRKQHK